MALACLGVQARVVGQGVKARFAQLRGHFFHPLARLAIHNARVVSLRPQVFLAYEAQQLRHAVLFLHQLVADVGAVKAAHKLPRLFQLQVAEHVVAGQCIGGGGQRHPWHAGVALGQHSQLPVFGPEVVAPLADAVGFVNRKQAQQPALVHRIHQRQEPRRGQPLGRGVQHDQLAAQQPFFNLLRLVQ